MQRDEIVRDMAKHFNMTRSAAFQCLDRQLGILTGRWSLDVIAFEQWLAEHTDFDPESEMSMAEFIEEMYGEEAVCFCMQAIGNIGEKA